MTDPARRSAAAIFRDHLRPHAFLIGFILFGLLNLPLTIGVTALVGPDASKDPVALLASFVALAALLCLAGPDGRRAAGGFAAGCALMSIASRGLCTFEPRAVQPGDPTGVIAVTGTALGIYVVVAVVGVVISAVRGGPPRLRR
jgi:hypothetical protein